MITVMLARMLQLCVQHEAGNHAAERGQQGAAQEQVESREQFAGMQEVPAELDGDQAMAEHQHVDALSDPAAIVGQLDQKPSKDRANRPTLRV